MSDTLEKLERLLQAGIPATIERLGGIEPVAASADTVVCSPFFDEFVLVLAQEWTSAKSVASLRTALVAGFEQNTNPAVVADAVDSLLRDEEIRADLGPELLEVLARRGVTDRVSHPLVSAYCLEGALRLALAGCGTKYKVLAAFTDLTGVEPPQFAAKVARLIGAAIDVWRDRDLLPVLERLVGVVDAEDQVAFEIGMAKLSFALDDGDRGALLRGLDQARAWFARSARASEVRLDAEAYGAMLDLVVAFYRDAPAADVAQVFNRFAEASRVHEAWTRATAGPEWLRPRATSAAEWSCLAVGLKHASDSLSRHSWLRAEETLLQVLAVYRKARSVRAVGDQLITPAIEAAFVTRQGLLAHLDDWLSSAATHLEVDEQTAQRLRERIKERVVPATGGVGKLPEDSSCKAISAVLGQEIASIVADTAPAAVPALESKLRSHVLALTESPIMDELVEQIENALVESADYSGQVRDAFQSLVLLTLRFLRDRQDLQRSTGAERQAYLYAWDKTSSAPLEKELGRDYREFLIGSPLSRAIHAELRDLAGGRVDVAVDLCAVRFSAELKREFNDASPASLRSYLGQAGLYSGTDVHLGLLLVLDLTSKLHGVPSLRDNVWVERVGAERPRFIVVFRVPGNRIDPCATLPPD